MEILKEIANVSGKSGLYRIIKPGRAGVIVESLDARKEKTMIGATARVSVLKDVSIFTEGAQESVPIADVFRKIRETHGEKVELDLKEASDKDMIEFLDEVLPDFDRSRVYVSDIKKIVNWYNSISEHFPEAFAEVEEPEENVETADVADEKASEGEKS